MAYGEPNRARYVRNRTLSICPETRLRPLGSRPETNDQHDAHPCPSQSRTGSSTA